jgi:hypothetical protein
MYWTAHFTLVHLQLSGRDRHRIVLPHWTTNVIWRCDGQDAVIEGNGDDGGNSINIRCPQADPNYAISKITVYNYTYDVRDYVNCEINHPFNKPAPEAKVAAAVMIFKSGCCRDDFQNEPASSFGVD